MSFNDNNYSNQCVCPEISKYDIDVSTIFFKVIIFIISIVIISIPILDHFIIIKINNN
jgi:hypothetical protein